ncbi:MAG: LPXTG cell wall anchor domain-containing protein, partial [Blautia sp.]|nr:LPXTG cell wall anchor domain-containing protein [Blautia sp.]
VVEGLKTGDSYTLRETIAPEGYKVTTDTTFIIDETGKVTSTGTVTEEGVLLVEDEKTHISVKKVDVADGEELEGAHIQIIDSEGNVVEEWDSTTEAHTVEGLKTGESYTLRETVAPEGYTITTDTTFIIDETGKVTSTGTVTEEGILLVEDAKAGGSLLVTKKLTDLLDGEDVYAIDHTYEVGLFEDEEGTIQVGETKTLEVRNAASGTVEFDGLEPGKTYYVREMENGEVIGSGRTDGRPFVVEYENDGGVTVIEDGDTTTFIFENQYFEIHEGFYKEAELTIDKKIISASGRPLNTTDVFYAGIFADPEFTELSDIVEANVLELDPAGGDSASVTVKVQIVDENPIYLYVTEVDENGNRLDDSFAYQYTVANGSVTLSAHDTKKTVTITNTKPEATPTVTPATTPKATPTPGQSKIVVQTGDDTPIALYVGLVLAALVAVLVILLIRKKNSR